MSLSHRSLLAFVTLAAAPLLAAQAPCLRADAAPYWVLGAARFAQSSGEGQRISGIGFERHYIDRRVLRRQNTGYRLEIRRTRLGLRDSTVSIGVEYAASGAVTRVTGDSIALDREAIQLLVAPCTELRAGRSFPDMGGRTDSVRSVVQQSATRSEPTRPLQLGEPVDTLGMRLLPLVALRNVTDTSRGQMARRLNQRLDTVRLWTNMSGTEIERRLIRPSDGQEVFRERRRQMIGRGWVPPHPDGDTVTLRAERATLERLTDSVNAAGILAFSRRGEVMVSANVRDTTAIHYREWRGDTLISRQVRRSGWRDELRTVWRDSAIVSAAVIEPGTVTQSPGATRRTFSVQRGYLRDVASPDSLQATPGHPWAIALDGFEDAVVPALLAIPADSQPHRFSMYGITQGRGGWLHWSVTVLSRGKVRVARFYTLQRQWAGSFIYTPAGELLFSNLGGQQGVTRVPMTGTRLAAMLDAQRGVVSREDLLPPPAPAAAPPPR